MTHGTHIRRPVGFQAFLIGPESFGRDVGRATIRQQDQAVLRLPHGTSGPWTTSYLTAWINGGVPPAINADFRVV